MYTSITYKTPPLVEAVSELSFVPEENKSNFSFVENFYNSIKEDFPHRNIIKKIGIKFQPTKEGNAAKNTLIEEAIDFYQFKSANNKLLIQIGENIVTVNHIRDYTRWADYEKEFLKYFKLFIEITGRDLLNGISVRYVNRINLTSDNFNLEDYFKFGLVLPDNLDRTISMIDLRVNLNYENFRDLLSLALRTAPSVNNSTYSFFFDLNYSFQKQNINLKQNIDFTFAKNWFAEAHINLNNAFEASLTEKCKQTFNS